MLEAKNIRKTYFNGKDSLEVLKAVDLKIEKAEFAAIIGPSGAGKSTLLHILGGLDSPSQGKVFFEENDLYALPEAGLAKIRNERIGFVFQFYHLLPEFNLLENVLMPALIRSQSNNDLKLEAKQRAQELLIQAGLGERLNHFPAQLSGGEKQRAAIVRGLINQPQLLLCDEPTGNLDTKTGEEIISLIKKFNQENKMAVVMVTHNIELTKTANRVYHLKDGGLQ
ncbi:MAG: ABC transporter ATP-binding protein [Candidatus Omnitrophica bacterium]|nr:ABC transporter ATP-binding protein [Candidatus Omnitrophota bacterium]MDD5653248.1 ABC transporter ATP-binding protein [Candidatus Omnitrophota bacterium]